MPIPWSIGTPDSAAGQIGQSQSRLVHASTVAVQGRAVMICGASGSGKSSLALQMMALGAGLVADDQTLVRAGPDGLTVTCPPALRGMIEARGFGLLAATPVSQADLALIVDMDQTETLRLPLPRFATLLGAEVRLVHKIAFGPFASILMQYLQAGDAAQPEQGQG